MALEFRLSLDNLCKLLGKEVTEQNKMDIYKAISLIFDNDPDYIEKFKYLFFYETFNEPQTSAKIAYITGKEENIR